MDCKYYLSKYLLGILPANHITVSSVCIAGIVRVYAISKMFQSEDITWNFTQGAIWSSVEPNIGIVCACLPTLYPLARRYLPPWFVRSGIGPSSQPYATSPSKPHSVYHLANRKHSRRSDDKRILTTDFPGNDDRPSLHDDGNDKISMDNEVNVKVKRDIALTDSCAV